MTEKVDQNSIGTEGDEGIMTIEKLARMRQGQFLVIDERFEKIDERFDGVDKRFEAVDRRFERLEEKVDKGFELIGQQFKVLVAEIKKIDYRAEINALDKRVLKLEQIVLPLH
jgi:archaellum component FlaC